MYHTQFNKTSVIYLHSVKCQTVLFQAIQFSLSKDGDHSRGVLKVPISIATTLRCKEGHYSFP